jgi:hypothetical protein
MEGNLLHRKGEPAVIHQDGRKEWWVCGFIHRTNGPAIVYPDGRKEWWLRGTPFSKADYFNNLSKSQQEAIIFNPEFMK